MGSLVWEYLSYLHIKSCVNIPKLLNNSLIEVDYVGEPTNVSFLYQGEKCV